MRAPGNRSARRKAVASPTMPPPTMITRWEFTCGGLNSRCQRNNRPVIASRTHLSLGENLVPRDPLERLLEDLARIRLEDDPLARPPAARVHLRVETLGKLLLVVMRVKLGAKVQVALRPAQGAEILLHVLGIGIAGNHRRHHERGVDDFAKSELLREVIRSAEERRGRQLAVDQ